MIHGTIGTVMFTPQGAIEIVVGDTPVVLLEGDGVRVTWGGFDTSLHCLLMMLFQFPAVVTVDTEARTARFEPKPVGR